MFPSTVLFAEFAFWEGNLILVVCFIAGLLDVRKRRFVKNKDEEVEEKPQRKTELPKFLKAFQAPEEFNKGSAFSSEYSTKPGERPRFLETEEKTSVEATTIETTEQNRNEATDNQ